MLSDEPGKRLSWVCSSQQLGALLGKTACEAMVSIGFRLDWLAARQVDGTKHMLVLFPADNGTIATWHNLWGLIAQTYGPEVDAALQPFRAELEQLVTWPPPPDDDSGNGYAAFDPAGELQRLSDLPVAVKYAEPGFLTAGRLLAAEPRTLYHARGFLDHSVGRDQNWCADSTGHNLIFAIVACCIGGVQPKVHRHGSQPGRAGRDLGSKRASERGGWVGAAATSGHKRGD